MDSARTPPNGHPAMSPGANPWFAAPPPAPPFGPPPTPLFRESWFRRALRKVATYVVHLEAAARQRQRSRPQGAHRIVLPMSSGTKIKPFESAQITSRPQNYAFRPERVILANPADWIIHDIKVGNVSQFAQSGDIPGAMFGATAIDNFVRFMTCQTAMDFVIVATYIGTDPEGAEFICGVLGTAATAWADGEF